MSYDVCIYRAEVKAKADTGLELDEFEHPAFPAADLATIVARLERRGYRPEATGAHGREFVKDVGGCPVQVNLFPAEFAFSVPFWDNAEQAIFEALMDAAELADSDGMAVYDPQTGEWTV